MVIEIYSPTPGYDPIRARAAEFIKSDLEKIRIKTVVYYYEWAALWPLIREAKVMSWLLGSGWSPDIGWLNFRFGSRPEGAGNWARYSNPEVDALIIELLNTFDFEKRRELAWKIQEKIALDAPVVNLYYRSSPNPYRTDKFEGWFYEAADSVFNRISVLRLRLKAAVCPSPVTPTPTPITPTPTPTPTPPPTTPVQTVITVTVAAPTVTAPPVTVLVTVTAPAEYTWVVAPVLVIVVVVVALALLLVKRR